MDPLLDSESLKKPQRMSATIEEEAPLEEMFSEVDFNFDLKNVHSDVGNLFEKFVQKQLVRAVLKKQYEKAQKFKESANKVTQKIAKTTGLHTQSIKLKQTIKKQRQEIEKTITAPPFLRTSDKFAFTLGIVGLCLTEFIMLRKPDIMPLFYAALIVPLLTARYYFYHKQKYHYFMLDFCYYVQVLLLLHLFVFNTGPEFFQILFSMSNGPLAVAIVMWRNSLVFHDLDKITSVFIHIFPPLVTFCIRWHPIGGDFSRVCAEPDCSMNFNYAITQPLIYYCIWQLLYIVKTELMDGHKIKSDKDIMTSVRWLTEVKPHPVYKMMKKYKKDLNPVMGLVVVQGIYTVFTLLPNLFIFEHHDLHVAYLCLIFVVCVWNGANYYFEVFSDTYASRMKRFLKEEAAANQEKANQAATGDNKINTNSSAEEKKVASPTAN